MVCAIRGIWRRDIVTFRPRRKSHSNGLMPYVMRKSCQNFDQKRTAKTVPDQGLFFFNAGKCDGIDSFENTHKHAQRARDAKQSATQWAALA
jgi:hypothetical protein